MNAAEFIHKWQHAELSEHSACHEHFLDLCALVGHPTPAEADKTGESFTFERGVQKHGGGHGWADVWKKGCFGWEYKKKRADLAKAYDQLLLYKEALDNPPLLVVCDMDVIEVHTQFVNAPTKVHRIPLAQLAEPEKLKILRAVFHTPESLKPGQTIEAITAEAARRIADIAQRLRDRGEEPHQVARFLDRLVFCMFAEDIGLLQGNLFTSLLGKCRADPGRFAKVLRQLFNAMAEGGDFGMEEIRWFNGALFQDPVVLDLTEDEIDLLYHTAQLDWSAVDPSIFGTLFERGLDPAKRSQLGAHYTSREDIETLVEPVVMQPLRREWADARDKAGAILEKYTAKKPDGKPKYTSETVLKHRERAVSIVKDFLERLSLVKVLDPACGSGNFLYVTLQKLKDLEKEVMVWAREAGLGGFTIGAHPRQLYGIEINPYAFELAQLTVWIGYLQWVRRNGFTVQAKPILETLEANFQNKDAILDLSDPDNPKEPEWPEVDFIVGNPPFLGAKKLYAELGDDYVPGLFRVWDSSVPREADLCCYWFEKVRRQIASRSCSRAGLLATQGIRGGYNREVLKRVKESGDIFFAISDRNWVLDGASVHVSLVGIDDGSERAKMLDGLHVERINANLSASADITQAQGLAANFGLFLRSPEKGGKFDLRDDEAISMLHQPNPNGRPNSDVLRVWVNAQSLVKRRDQLWIIDFPPSLSESEAAAYQKPFAYAEANVREFRAGNRDERLRMQWWIHRRTGESFRNAAAGLERLPCTPMVSKHRIFVWLDPIVQPDKTIYAFARSDDYFFGVLHSRLHEVWALRLGTRLETRPRYTPTTCFETFPFPDGAQPPSAGKNAQEPQSRATVLQGTRPRNGAQPPSAGGNGKDTQPRAAVLHPQRGAAVLHDAIAQAAKDLDRLRNNWLNPSEWTKEEVLEFPGSVDGPWARYVHDANEKGIGTVKYPRIVPKDDECAKRLKKRTLTNLYNERPTWLALAHKKLDAAVFAAYGWPTDLSDEEILEKLLALNLQRAEASPPPRE